MGTLKTDIIIGQGNNNEVTFLSNKFTGTASGNITLPGEGGTTTTALQGGLIKVRCLASMADNSIYGSNNISSLGDDGTGTLGHNFTNNMANRNYSTSIAGAYADTTGFSATAQTAIETDEVTLKAGDASGSTYDMNPFSMMVGGDLA